MKHVVALVALCVIFCAAFARAVPIPYPGSGSGGGGGSAPTASPSPGLVAASATQQATPVATPTIAIPGGAQDGDCMVVEDCNYHAQYTTAGNLLNALASYDSDPNPNASGNFEMFWAGFAFFSPNTQYGYASTHVITATDIAAGYVGLSSNIAAGDRVGWAIFRHVACAHFDGISTSNNEGNTTTTAPRPPSMTLGSAGDLTISLACGSNVTTYTPPAGMTNAFTGDVGNYIDYSVQSSSGAFQPAAGTYGTAIHSGQMQAAMRNLGGVQ